MRRKIIKIKILGRTIKRYVVPAGTDEYQYLKQNAPKIARRLFK